LLDALMGDVAFRLAQNVGRLAPLLHERSLPRRSHVQVRLHGMDRAVPTGTPARRLLPERMKGKLVAAALVDRRAVSLTTPLTSECELVPLTTEHWEGQRVYRHSLALLALEAGARARHETRLEMGPSIGFAQRIVVHGAVGPLESFALEVERAMHALVLDKAPLLEEWWAIDEAREYFERRGSVSAARLLSTSREPAAALVSYGSVYALAFGPMLPDTSELGGFRVLPGDGVLLLVYGSEAAARPLPSIMAPVSATPAPDVAVDEEADAEYIAAQARKVSRHAAVMIGDPERWLQTLGITSVGAFNHACIAGEVPQLIRVSEGFQEKQISRIADAISSRIERVRVVCIAGPSSSGKTTFIRRLKVQLQVDGINPLGLSLDDYYVDRERSPRDESGEYDFEAFESIRVDLLQGQLTELLAGRSVKTARYDFTSGRSQPAGGREVSLGPRDLVMLEGIHGLNPQLLSALPEGRVFRIFVCPLAQLPFDELSRVHASDVRLIRRIVRDRHGRGLNAAETIQRWPSVRAGERRHIFPFQHHADAVFDSSLIYELSVLRVFAERYLLEVPRDHASYTTAFRLLGLLDGFVAIYPDHVPPTSILREFIGGSGFEA
jgi:uridine kinase